MFCEYIYVLQLVKNSNSLQIFVRSGLPKCALSCFDFSRVTRNFECFKDFKRLLTFCTHSDYYQAHMQSSAIDLSPLLCYSAPSLALYSINVLYRGSFEE